MIQTLIALSVMCLGSGVQAAEFDDLEPCEDVFSWCEPPSSYDLALRAALIGEHRYRECQVVAKPSFEREWAVFVLREEEHDAPQIIYKRMKTPLYSALMDALSDGGRKKEYSNRGEEQAAALRTLHIDVETFVAPLSDDAAEILEQVWSRMLSRVRYPNQRGMGFDGTTYHVSQWIRGDGFRSGTTSSPEENTRTAALVHLADELRVLAEAVPSARSAMEVVLVADARALLTRLDRLEDPSSPQQPR